MDIIFQFFRDMTFWNWITLIAFIFFPLNALNAFLSLKSRYRDWRGTRSKKAFEKRLKELETLVNTVGVYRKEPKRYFFVVIDLIATILIMSLEAGFCFVFVYITTIFFMKNLPLLITLSVLCLIFLVFALIHANRLLWLARYVHVPELVKNNVLIFLSSGAKKGLIPEKGGKDIVELLFNHNMLTMGEAEELQKLVDNSHPPNKN